jgi:hypothetical protein
MLVVELLAKINMPWAKAGVASARSSAESSSVFKI